MLFSVNKFTLITTTAAFLIGAAAPAFAQTDASAPAATAQAPASAAKMTKKQARAQARAQRKAEHKAARAKNTAELKRLEGAGYNPAANDPNYPQKLQDAQKKLNAPAGASQ
jgi:4'-phosphopantetheinyl transferase EntD